MKITTVWKVTTKDCKSAMSLSPKWCKELTVTYSPDSWTVPNKIEHQGGAFPLMVFDSLEKASRFFYSAIRYNANWVIWEAQALNVRKKLVVLRMNNRFSLWGIIAFWTARSRANLQKKPFQSHGFYVADAVKLVKIVDPEFNWLQEVTLPPRSPILPPPPLQPPYQPSYSLQAITLI